MQNAECRIGLTWEGCRWTGGFPHIGGVWRTMFAPTGEVQSNTVTNMNFSRLENHDYQSGFVQYPKICVSNLEYTSNMS